MLFEELFDYVQDYLIKEKETSTWIKQNLLLVLESVFNLKEYKNYKFFVLNPFA
jgi:hypothetical protein